MAMLGHRTVSRPTDTDKSPMTGTPCSPPSAETRNVPSDCIPLVSEHQDKGKQAPFNHRGGGRVACQPLRKHGGGWGRGIRNGSQFV